MTIDKDAEIARQINAIIHNVKMDGIQNFTGDNSMEWYSLCGLNVGVCENGALTIRSHNMHVDIASIQGVNDNAQSSTPKPMLSVSFKRGNPSTLAAWQKELTQFRLTTSRLAVA